MNALAIYIKNNVPGKVKTRLAQDLGDDKASEVYDELLRYTKEVTAQLSVNRYVYYADHITTQDLWENDLYDKRVQVSGSLGDRMSDTMESLSLKHQKSVIIGSDCTQLVPGTLIAAYNALDKADVVLGPSLDGGYYLIGMKKHHPTLFEDIAWSTKEVLNQTIEKIKETRLSYRLLAPLSDIDYVDDLKKYPI